MTREAPCDRRGGRGGAGTLAVTLDQLFAHRVHGVDNTGNVRVWPAEQVLLHLLLSGYDTFAAASRKNHKDVRALFFMCLAVKGGMLLMSPSDRLSVHCSQVLSVGRPPFRLAAYSNNNRKVLAASENSSVESHECVVFVFQPAASLVQAQ